MKKAGAIVVLVVGFMALADTARAQMVCCDFNDSFNFIDGSVAIGAAAVYDRPSKSFGPAITVKTMLLKFGDVRFIGVGGALARFNQPDLGTKAMLTLVPVAVGWKHTYIAVEWTPLKVGRYKDSDPNLRRKSAHTWLVSLNYAF